MKWLAVLGVLIGCQLIAASVMVVLGKVWTAFDANAVHDVMPGLVIGFIAIMISIAVPCAFLKRRL